ncbi:hypothetical protein II810_00195 [bacterium]|nr:hypothetical protein [bacterium]
MKPEPIERIIAPLSYITMGMVGFFWLIISLFTKARLKPFLQYHVFQSIFISLLFAVIAIFLGWVSNLLSLIPFINTLVAQITFLLNMPVLLGYSIIQLFVYLLIIYLAVTSFLGQYSYVFWVSDIINQNFKN